MSLLADLDQNNVVDIDLGSAAFKANAHRYMAEWARADRRSTCSGTVNHK